MLAIKPEIIFSHGIFDNNEARENLRNLVYDVMTNMTDNYKRAGVIKGFLEDCIPYRKWFVQIFSKFTKNYLDKNTYANEIRLLHENIVVSITDLTPTVFPIKIKDEHINFQQAYIKPINVDAYK